MTDSRHLENSWSVHFITTFEQSLAAVREALEDHTQTEFQSEEKAGEWALTV